MPGVKLQTAVADNVVGLEYQRVFNVGVVDKLPDGRKERFHVLINPVTDAGRVDADIGHVVLFGQFFDGVRLGAEVHPAPLVTLKNAELTARHGWRSHHNASGTVAVLRTFCRVITDPHLAPAKRAQGQCMKVGPDFPAVHHARLQLAEREHGREIVYELTHQQVLVGALLSPIGLVVTALAGVALVVWKYWQPITAFLGGVVEGFKAAAGPISAAFEPLKPVFQWIGDKVQALWGWFTDLLTPVKSTSAELQSAAAMGRRFGEALAEGLNMVMHPLDSLKSGVSWLLEKLGIVSKEAAKAKLPESVTRQQPATVNADGKVMMPSGGFPSWGYGFAGMYDSGGYIPRGQFGIVGENGPEIVNGPANVTSRRNTAALAAVVAGMMGVAAAPAELPPLHPLALPAKGGEAIVSRAATVPLVQRIEAPTQIIIQTQPGQSAQDIAREVARQLDERERRLKAKARSNYSDQGGYDA
ncbi:hypothetical protein FGAF1005_10810 [Escherichia coli]|nr:hypothetical protein FGAF1005_10810 [Escherichia coli]